MNYKKVMADFKTGKLDKKKVMLRIDNDGGYWQVSGIKDEHDREREEMRLQQMYGDPGGYDDVVAILQSAGAPADWV